MRATFVAIALALAASTGRAGADGGPTFLGWANQGIALARLPSPCSQCEVQPDDKIHVADGTGRVEVLYDVPSLKLGLAPGTEVTQPTLNGEPVKIDLVLENVPKADPERGGSLRVVATRNGAKVASTLVPGMTDHVRAPKIVAMSGSLDGHHLAVAIAADTGFGDARGQQFALAVLGPAPGLPDAPAARNDIVDVRHDRVVDYQRVAGWTSDGAAVIRSAHVAPYLDNQTMFTRSTWIDDGAHKTFLSDAAAIWAAGTKAPARIDQPSASAMIEAESFGLAITPPLKPSSTAKAPEIRAISDVNTKAVALVAGKKSLATISIDSEFSADDVRVRSVTLSPDGHRAVVTISYTETNHPTYGSKPLPTKTRWDSVVVTL